MSIIPASELRNASQKHPGDRTLSPLKGNSLVALLYRTVWLNGLFVILLVSNLFFTKTPNDEGTK